MADRGIYLYNSTVNSGTAVWLKGAECRKGWKNLNTHKPSSGSYNIVEVDQAGWENPIFKIRGMIEVDDTDSDIITESLITLFARAYTAKSYLSVAMSGDTIVPLSDSEGDTSETTNGGKTGKWIPVRVKDFDIPVDTSSEKAHFINYSITLVEDTA